jgi:hypothetical protein
MMKVIKQKLKDDEEAKQTTRIDISLVLRETKSLNKPRNPASFPFNDVPAGANNNETDMPPVSSLECISSEVSTASTMSSLSYSSQDGNARHSQVTSSSPRPHGQRNICKEHDHQENESSRIFSRGEKILRSVAFPLVSSPKICILETCKPFPHKNSLPSFVIHDRP